MVLLSEKQFKREVERRQKAGERIGRQLELLGPEVVTGDIIVINCGVGLDLRWLLLKSTSMVDPYCTVYAVDSSDLVGTHDIDIHDDISGMPGTVRCALSIQIPRFEFDDSMVRVGRLSNADMNLVFEKIEDIATGKEFVAAAATAIDNTPEYRGWIDQVADEIRQYTFDSERELQLLAGETGWIPLVIERVVRLLKDTVAPARPLDKGFGAGLLLAADGHVASAAAPVDLPVQHSSDGTLSDVSIIFESLDFFLIAFRYNTGTVLRAIGVQAAEEPKVYIRYEHKNYTRTFEPVAWRTLSLGIFDSGIVVPPSVETFQLKVGDLSNPPVVVHSAENRSH